MVKIDKSKSKRICAVLLVASLSFPILGCNLKKDNDELYSYSGYEIIDNKGMKLYLTNDQIEEIENTDEKYVELMFGENKMIFESGPIKKEIRANKQETLVITGIITAGIAVSTFGIISPVLPLKKKNHSLQK